MKILTITTLIFLISIRVNAQTFDELIKDIDNHSKIASLKNKKQSIFNEGRAKSRWEEPQLKFEAMNFPSEDPRFGLSAMSSVGITLSQKVPLTSKYSNILKSYNYLVDSQKYKLEILKRNIILEVWNHAIKKEKIIKSIKIYEENMGWIKDMIKVSGRLYSTGKISQQAILDLKIRKTQIDSNIKTNEILLKKIDRSLSKLLDKPNQDISLHLNSMPWNILKSTVTEKEKKTPQELLLISLTKAASYKRKADKQNRLPEINVGLNYKSRNNVDNHGDFIGGFLSVPIGVGARSYQYESSSYNYSKAKNDLRDYQNELVSFKEELKLEILKLESELNILVSQTIKFAQTARKISSKSYSVGSSDYLELLRSEFQLQNLLLQKIEIESKIKENKVLYIFESGLDIY
tara:strand:- start:4444 stop:5658 length:1215 start_codon:yes stop_codon:yes gene_type:complete